MPDEIDVGALSAQVAGEIFLAKPAGDSEPQASAPLPDIPPASPPEPPAYTGKPLPKAWKKEMEEHWKKLDPAVHDYVHNREADVDRGITTYKQGHEQWKRFTDPFLEVLKKHPDVDPVQLASNLMRSHLALTYSPPEQKQALVQQLLQAYGISLDGATPPAGPDPRVMQEITLLKTERQQEKVAAQLKVVESFFTDPKNEFAKELEEDILNLIQTGVASDLPAAYEKAMWLNPAVRAKVIAKQAQPSKADPTRVRTAETPVTPAPRKGSIQDTIDSVVAKHYNTH